MTPEISFTTLEGQFHPSTLRVKSTCGREIVVDNECNNNFIRPSVANKLKLQQVPTMVFTVTTGSGAILTCDSKCVQVPLNIQGYSFVTNLFVLEFKDTNVVLGVQWLIDLGPVLTNYRDLTMQFTLGGREVMLQGDHILASNPIKDNSLHKMISANIVFGFCTLQVLNETSKDPTQGLPGLL